MKKSRMPSTQPKAEYSADKAGKTKDAAGGQTTETTKSGIRGPAVGRVFGNSAFTTTTDVCAVANDVDRVTLASPRHPPRLC